MLRVFWGGRGECVGGGERVLEGGESVLGDGRVLEEGRECWGRGECVGGGGECWRRGESVGGGESVLGEGESVGGGERVLGEGRVCWGRGSVLAMYLLYWGMVNIRVVLNCLSLVQLHFYAIPFQPETIHVEFKLLWLTCMWHPAWEAPPLCNVPPPPPPSPESTAHAVALRWSVWTFVPSICAPTYNEGSVHIANTKASVHAIIHILISHQWEDHCNPTGE